MADAPDSAGTPRRISPLVFAGKGSLLTIAVGAEESEILQAVVGSFAVDVVKNQD